jgi:nucleoside-diphosphate-sugar epimerase
MLLGKYSQNVVGAYRAWYTVDVRDVAEAHIRMLESVNVSNGERFIAWSTETRNVEEVCASIDRLLPELGFAGAELVDPLPEKVQAKEAEFRAIWGGCELRNDRIRETLDMEFRPLDVSIRDCVESLISVGKVAPVRNA